VAPGQRTWDDAFVKAKVMVSNMTNEEKNNIVTGLSYGLASMLFPKNGCTGSSGGVERFNFTGLCLQDGPAGVRGQELVSAFPSGIHIGASWNRELANQVGTSMGAEFKRKGAHVALGPVVGPLGRIAKGGRNFEGKGQLRYFRVERTQMLIDLVYRI
jgi:beta-glucosidase